MRPQAYIGIAILVAFGLFIWFAGPVAKEVIYLLGCFAFGWKIDAMANAVYNFYRKYKTT